MKKGLILILMITVITALLWFNCNPVIKNSKNTQSDLSKLDNLSSTSLAVTSTIQINGTTYDGSGDTIISQIYNSDEITYPVFNVTNGTVKNLTITHLSGASQEGIYISGNCTIDNITVPEAAEGDVVQVKKPGTSVISNVTANNSFDDIFRINDLCTITYKNFTGDVMRKMVRQNGGTTWKCTVYIDGANLTGTSEAVLRSNSLSTQVYYRNITCNLPASSWWYGSAGYTGAKFKVTAY